MRRADGCGVVGGVAVGLGSGVFSADAATASFETDFAVAPGVSAILAARLPTCASDPQIPCSLGVHSNNVPLSSHSRVETLQENIALRV